MKDEEATLPAVSMMAVSPCPEVSERTETESPLRICPHHPPSPPARCDWGAGYKAVAAKEKLLVIILCGCLQSGQICTAVLEGRRSETTGHGCVFMLPSQTILKYVFFFLSEPARQATFIFGLHYS